MNIVKTIYLYEVVLQSIREFFTRKNFHEVITPVFSLCLPQEPTIYPFTTIWHTQKKSKTFYLASSPERTLKRVLGEGIGNCFAVSKSFRDLENSGPLNIPEFLMLEWYRKDSDYEFIMAELQECIFWIKKKVDIFVGKSSYTLAKKWEHFSLIELFKKYAQLDFVAKRSDREFFIEAEEKGYRVEKNTNWEQIFHQIFLNEIYPHLPRTPFFLVDFPSRISPLCRKRTDNPRIAERFELYIGGIELANGNTENTNGEEVRTAFRAEQRVRRKERKTIVPIDEEFLRTLEKMQKRSRTYAGVGLGIERLMTILTNQNDIHNVVFNV